MVATGHNGDPELASLRDTLSRAAELQKRAQSDCDRFQEKIDGTYLDIEDCPKLVLNRLAFLRRQQLQAQSEFRRALAALRMAGAIARASVTHAPPGQETVTPVPKESGPVPISQFVTVEVKHGKVVTRPDLTAEFILSRQPWPRGSPFHREFYFPDRLIPEQYEYVLTHEGVKHEPTRFVSLHYSQEEFIRLCELEIETNSEFVLDGERIGAERWS
jgi:hypothetical protein